MPIRKLTLLIIAIWLLAGCTPASLSQPIAPATVQATADARPSVGAQPTQPVPPPPPGGPKQPRPEAITTARMAPIVSAPAATASVPLSAEAEGVLTRVTGTYQFTEGPAVDTQGNVYFSDINAGKIYRWSAASGQVCVYRQGLNAPNGLAFDHQGNLVVCEGGNGQLIAIDALGQITVVAATYNQKRFNEPNDLWIDAQGGIFFTDPVYQGSLSQAGECVYYISPDRSQVTRVISDLVRPNGITGSADGQTLYVADHGAGKTYAYALGAGGALSNKRLVVDSGSDGLKVDASGNLYLTTPNQVGVYSPAGRAVREIPTTENPTNLAFAGADHRTLFIAARTQVYTYTLPTTASTSTASSSGSFTLTSSEVGTDGLLPMEYTCDGASASLPLTWSGAPEGTKSYAVIMHHVASPTDVHWYLVLWNLPPTVTGLGKNDTGGGTVGTNSVNDRLSYSPPCSKGPGLKSYIYTVYALADYPSLSVPAAQVNRQVLLDAIAPITLATAELHVQYARK